MFGGRKQSCWSLIFLNWQRTKVLLKPEFDTEDQVLFSLGVGVTRIEQQKCGHISNVTGHNRPKLLELVVDAICMSRQLSLGHLSLQHLFLQHLSPFHYNFVPTFINLEYWLFKQLVWVSNCLGNNCSYNIFCSFSIMEYLS